MLMLLRSCSQDQLLQKQKSELHLKKNGGNVSMKLNHANKGLNAASTIYFNEAVSLQAPCSYILENSQFRCCQRYEKANGNSYL